MSLLEPIEPILILQYWSKQVLAVALARYGPRGAVKVSW